MLCNRSVSGRMATAALMALAPSLSGQSAPSGTEADAEATELRGRVVDAATLQPIHGAFVGLSEVDQGFLTDTEGRFTLRVVRSAEYLISASELGYERRTVTVSHDARGDIVIRLDVDPVQLGEIRIMVDRFGSRRKAASVAARAWERRDLLASASMNMLDYLRGRTGRPLRECPYLSAFGRVCVMSRGRLQPVRVYLDEMPVFGGLDELRIFRPHELFMVEVYDSGRHIRLYSTRFMDRLARTGLRLNPVPINR
ncbi:MAG: hypothetical protein ACI9OJ_004932 [Myxococcota bacterium]|jgi:hypothetical protein